MVRKGSIVEEFIIPKLTLTLTVTMTLVLTLDLTLLLTLTLRGQHFIVIHAIMPNPFVHGKQRCEPPCKCQKTANKCYFQTPHTEHFIERICKIGGASPDTLTLALTLILTLKPTRA